MNKLKYAYRNINVKYDKRAICNVNVLYQVLDSAKEEKIQMYMLVFAYDSQLYSIGIENNDTFKLGTPDGNDKSFSTIDELKQYINFNHDVTVLSEFQSENVMDTPIQLSIRDNYLLKDYIVEKDDINFNINMNDGLNEQFNPNSKDKGVNYLLIGGVIFVIVIIIIVILLNKYWV